MEPGNPEPLLIALRRLTVAVWAVAVVVGLYVALSLAASVSSRFANSNVDTAVAPSQKSAFASASKYADLYKLPVEKQIEAAAVIAVAMFRPSGERTACVLTEILKQTPGGAFPYKVGDELRECSYYPKPQENRGDGEVLFFVGDETNFRFASTIYGDRIPGLENMPIATLRKLAASSNR